MTKKQSSTVNRKHLGTMVHVEPLTRGPQSSSRSQGCLLGAGDPLCLSTNAGVEFSLPVSIS